MLQTIAESHHPGLRRQENDRISQHQPRRREPRGLDMLRIEGRPASLDPNMLRMMAVLLRLVHEWLPLRVGMLRLAVESHHPTRERRPLTVDSEHILLARRRLDLRMLRIGRQRPELELAVQQPGIG